MDATLFDAIPHEISQLLVSFSDSIQNIHDSIVTFKEIARKSDSKVMYLLFCNVFIVATTSPEHSSGVISCVYYELIVFRYFSLFINPNNLARFKFILGLMALM